MRFEYSETNDKTLFSAILEGDETIEGIQAQGPYPLITLINNILEINYVSKKILHPDIIAAICLTAFYPWIKYSATMPFPVSNTFADNLQMDVLPQHEVIDGIYRATKPITITNIDDTLEPYSGGNITVISYGGGIDSTAVALMFPDFPLVHTSNSSDKIEVKNVIKQFVKENLKNDAYIIDSNCKEITKNRDFTTFTNIFLIPLILSADLNIKNICCGEPLESSCTSNGKKYFPQFNPEKRNRWLRFYNNIGINIFSPIAGCSELITSNIVFKHNLTEKVLFCELNKGYPCYKCTKCLRKLLESNFHGYDYNLNNFNEKYITKFLQSRPLHYSFDYIETIKTIKDVPVYMKESIKDIIDIRTDLFHKIYSKSFVYFPEDIKDKLITELTKSADLMTDEEEKYLESWDLTE